MIKEGDTITISGYDYDKMMPTKRNFTVLHVFPNFILAQHQKAKYRECFGIFELIKNGYIPNFTDAKEREGHMVKLGRYTRNKLLQGY